MGGSMARIMWDSTTPAISIPRTAAIVAGYVNGDYAWKPSDWTLFADAIKVRISVTGNIPCDVYDVERGDYLPSDTQVLLATAHDAGVERPTFYFDKSSYAEVRQYIPPPGAEWAWWAADWTGRPHSLSMPDGGIASVVQYANPTYTGGNYDLSAVYDPTWPILSIPIQGRLTDMPAVIAADGTVLVYAIGAGARQGQLLEFRRKLSDATWNDVRDVTDQIDTEKDPNGPYTVSQV